MRQYSSIISIIMFLGACVSTAPSDNAPFDVITNIAQLEGVYKNQGDGGPDENVSVYLSRVFWPDDGSPDHRSIDKIKVEKQSQDTLVVNAFNGDIAVKTATFIEGREFSIEDGVIVLSDEAGIAGLKADEPLLGVYAGSRKLGLDEKGHGKFHSHEAAAGLAYMVFPVAAGLSRDVRFYRIDK